MVPPPPSRRPTVAERISMLQMAQTRHTGYQPREGVPLVMPGRVPSRRHKQNERADANERDAFFNAGRRHNKVLGRRGLFGWQQKQVANVDKPPIDVITIRLMDEREW